MKFRQYLNEAKTPEASLRRELSTSLANVEKEGRRMFKMKSKIKALMTKNEAERFVTALDDLSQTTSEIGNIIAAL